ncbi:carbohydrate ABC transporter membrane protein 1, CUT1 family [Rhizobiales bacterium GAS191]|nr:carbohydrate ABC transporter membrane protein 1, CUT1 family [Rhizobiales bacterium GAS191]
MPAERAPRRQSSRAFVRHSPAWLRRAPYLYIAPMLLLIGIFVYWPLIATIGLSFAKWNLNPDRPIALAGFDNYARLASSPLFRDALRNTGYFLIGSLPLKILLPIPVAVAIWSLGRKGEIYRAILFLPTLISFVVVAIVFLWLLNPIGGMIPLGLRALGLQGANPLAEPASALWTVLLISTWKIFGFNVLIYVAGLARIRGDLIEAMQLDGAGAGRIFVSLVWPLLTPTTFFVLVSTTIFSLQQVFTPIDIMTEGGPQNGTTNLFYMVYQLTFRTFDVGRGAAATVLLFALLLLITTVKFRVVDRHVYYDQ